MMSPEQLKFKQFLETHVPDIGRLFDWDNRAVVFSRVDRYLGYASSGEAILARFFVGVWLHDNRYDFDIISAVKRLDTSNLEMIYTWLREPVWP